MKYTEFIKQDKYCREHNIPEGKGCDNCPTSDKPHCADALRNLAAKLRGNITTPESKVLSEELQRDYGIGFWCQLALLEGILEFPQ